MTDILEEMRQILDKKEETTKQCLKLLLEASVIIKCIQHDDYDPSYDRTCWLEEYDEFRGKLDKGNK